MADPSDAIRVFISYSRADSAAADSLVADLEDRGFYVTIDRRDLPYGEEWQHELTDFIIGCDTVVWLVSPASVGSRWVNWELGEVRRLSKRLVPVVIEQIAPEALPEAIGKIHLLPTQGIYVPAEQLETLVATLESDRHWIKDHTRLGDRAREWRATNRRSDRLLRGAALRDAETWLRDRPLKAPPPAHDVLELLAASERGAKHRQYLFVAALTLVALTTAALATVALLQRNNAVFALAQSKAAEYAARARSTDTGQPFVATALALRSLDSLKNYGQQSAEGESALRTVLSQMHGKNAYCLPNLSGGLPDTVESLDISADNKLVAVGTSGNAVCIYANSDNGPLQLIDALQSYGAPVDEVRFSADSKWLFTMARSGYLRALDLNATVLDPTSRKFFDNHYRFDRIAGRDQVEGISFDPAAKRLALFDRESMTLEVRSLVGFIPNGEPAFTFKPEGNVLATGFSSNGQYLAALVTNRALRPSTSDFYSWPEVKRGLHVQLWNLATGQSRVIEPLLAKVNEIYLGSGILMGALVGEVEVGPSGEWVAAAIGLHDQHRLARQFAAEVWNLGSPHPESVLLFDGAYEDRADGSSRVTDFGFSPDGAWFYGSSGPELRLWKLEGQRLSVRPIELSSPYARAGSRRAVGDMYRTAIAPDSSHIAAVGSNGALVVWDLRADGGPANNSGFVVERADDTFGSPETLRFSPDSGTVAIGGDNGAVKLCSISNACGPLEPATLHAPPAEGQWKQLWAAKNTWIAAVSEADQLWFWRSDPLGAPFLVANLSADSRRQKVIAKEYAISSGTPGSPTALMAPPDGGWAAAFVIQQYGFNTSLSLLRLDDRPAQYRVDIASMGCTGDGNDNSFRTISLDPYSRRVYVAHSLSGCTASAALPGPTAEPAATLSPDHEASMASVPMAYSEHFIAARETGSETGICVWTRELSNGRPQDCVLRISDGRIFLSADDRVFAVEKAPSVQDDLGNHVARVSQRQANGALSPWENLLACDCDLTLTESPDHRWLVAIEWKPESEASITLWRIGEFAKPALQRKLAAGGAKLDATFSDNSHRLIIGPTVFPVTYGEPAPPSLKALAIDLGDSALAAREFDVILRDTHVSCTRSNFSCDPIAYVFSPDGEWLASAHPGNLWRVDGPTPRLDSSLDMESAMFSPDSRWLAADGEKGTSMRRLRETGSDDRGLLGTGSPRGFLVGDRLLMISDGAIGVHRLDLDDLKQSAAHALSRNPTPDEWWAAFGEESYARLFASLSPSVDHIEQLLDQAAQADIAQKPDLAGDAFARAAALAVETKSLGVGMFVAEAALKAGYPDQALVAAKFAARLVAKNETVVEFLKEATAASQAKIAKIEMGKASRQASPSPTSPGAP